MGSRIGRSWLCALLTTVAACSEPLGADQAVQVATAPGETRTDTTLLAGRTLTLFAENGRCSLEAGGSPQRQMLAPTAPCYFTRRSGKVKQHSYPKANVAAVIIVTGTPATADEKRRFAAPPGDACGMMSQGVLLRGSRIEPSRQVSYGGLSCRNAAPDEKDFYDFAHSGATPPAAIEIWRKRRLDPRPN